MINSDIFVTASQVEGSPNSLIEAVCLGIPSIATDCPTGPKVRYSSERIASLYLDAINSMN